MWNLNLTDLLEMPLVFDFLLLFLPFSSFFSSLFFHPRNLGFRVLIENSVSLLLCVNFFI